MRTDKPKPNQGNRKRRASEYRRKYRHLTVIGRYLSQMSIRQCLFWGRIFDRRKQ